MLACRVYSRCAGNGSADALAKAHERMAAFGVSFPSAGASMTVSSLTDCIRNHMKMHGGENDCGCEDEYKKKDCSGSKGRQHTMRKGKKKNSLDMSSLSEAMVATDKWFSAHLSELKE